MPILHQLTEFIKGTITFKTLLNLLEFKLLWFLLNFIVNMTSFDESTNMSNMT